MYEHTCVHICVCMVHIYVYGPAGLGSVKGRAAWTGLLGELKGQAGKPRG